MSHIFDALQRSEAESSGIDLSALAEATELLQRAERRVASKWESAVLLGQPDGRERAERDASFGLRAEPPVVAAVNVPERGEHLPADERLDTLGKFQSLQVSIPLQS